MKLYTALMIMSKEYNVIFVINFVWNDFMKKRLKAGTHNSNTRKRQQLKQSLTIKYESLL